MAPQAENLLSADRTVPGVTIIIPTFNYAHFLPAAVESALRQTYQPVEVVVVDDGSADNTPAVLALFGARIRVVRQENAGLSAARNAGLRHARYGRVVFLDADDLLEPPMVERLCATLEELPAHFALVACNTQRVGVDGEPLPQRRFGALRSRAVSAAELVLSNRFCPAVLARREVFAMCGGFDEMLRSSEDRDMWIRVASRYGVFALWEPLVRKRLHGANMSHHAVRQSHAMRRVLGKAWRARVVPAWRLDFWARVLALYLFQSALMFHDSGRRGTARWNLLLSGLAWPWFWEPGSFEQPTLFRARAFARSVLRR